MNLNAIANNMTSAVHPNKIGQVMVSSGYTTAADGTRTPSFAAAVELPMNIQALTSADIRQLDNLNISGSTHTIYLNGRVDGIVRNAGKGGDIILFDSNRWLVTGVLEAWPDWTKVSVQEQLS